MDTVTQAPECTIIEMSGSQGNTGSSVMNEYAGVLFMIRGRTKDKQQWLDMDQVQKKLWDMESPIS
ncbi:MAG: hypothetical protein JEZ06_05370 [Anaerolineaceae bacterium]|nr:hypothetical protein [Anaerolineaceae bacterium]